MGLHYGENTKVSMVQSWAAATVGATWNIVWINSSLRAWAQPLWNDAASILANIKEWIHLATNDIISLWTFSRDLIISATQESWITTAELADIIRNAWNGFSGYTQDMSNIVSNILENPSTTALTALPSWVAVILWSIILKMFIKWKGSDFEHRIRNFDYQGLFKKLRS